MIRGNIVSICPHPARCLSFKVKNTTATLEQVIIYWVRVIPTYNGRLVRAAHLKVMME